MATSRCITERRKCRSRKASPRARPSSFPHRRVASEGGGHLAFVGGTNLQTLVDGLNPGWGSSRPTSSPCQAIKAQAASKPSWWCNEQPR